MDSSSLNQFYSEVSKETNVTFADQVINNFVKLFPEYQEELQTPIHEINFSNISNNVNQSQLTQLLSWKQPQQNGKQKSKSSILKLTPDKGDLAGLGNQFKGTVLLKGFKSKWASHQFQFTEEKKGVLKDDLNDMILNKGDMDYRDFKSMLQLSLQFDLLAESKQFQDEDCLEQIKALELLKYLVCRSAVNASGIQLVSGSEIKCNGFLQDKYDQYYGQDVKKLSCVMNVKKTSDKFDDSVEIVQYCQTETGYELKDATTDCVTIIDYINLIKNRKMDIVVSLNSCSLKKDGRNVLAMPKLQILQIILQDSVNKQSTNVGLNLNKKR